MNPSPIAETFVMRNSGNDDKTILFGLVAAGVACLIVFGGIGLAIVATSSTSTPTSRQAGAIRTELRQPQRTIKTEEKREWYAGGNLHQSRMSQWRKATYANRLATAADMAIVLLQMDGVNPDTVDIEKTLRPLAESLVKSIDAYGRENPKGNEKVSEVAISVWIIAKSSR